MSNSNFIDFRLGLNSVAWAVLHNLDGEPTFAPYDHETHRYEIDCSTSAFYNGRERGFCLIVRKNWTDRKALYIMFSEYRSSDHIIVYSWVGNAELNPPQVPPNEEVYRKGKGFGNKSKIQDASDYIIRLMRDFLSSEEDETLSKNIDSKVLPEKDLLGYPKPKVEELRNS